jgi:KDO2-lipid IV(A) lauroyltransferase
MHLETQDRETAAARVIQADLDHIETTWKASSGGLIFTVGHVGNNEAIAAAVADRGWPINVVADDSSFPEMFERFRRLREAWGVHVIPWRNLREIYKILRNREMLALLIDWGYRADGIPVRLFGTWTTLPAGPATLAAKTGSAILPVSIRRTPDRRFHVSYAPVVTVASSSPADLQRATQAIADALEATVGAAPDQWYSFKPMWPPTQAEAAELEARAAAMLADDGSTPAQRGAAATPASPASPAADVAGAGPTAGDAVADAPAVDPHLRTAEA